MLQVRASGDRLVPLAQFVRFSETAVPAELERFGQRRAVELDLRVADGKPLQQAIDELARAVRANCRRA